MNSSQNSQVMYEGIYYDRFKNKMHLWENINGNSSHSTYDYEHIYYVPDPTKRSAITDVYGTPVKKCVTDRKKNIPDVPNICEGDLSEEIKFLNNRYEKVKMYPNYENMSVGFYDIETEYDEEFPHAYDAAYPVNLITLYCSKSKNLYIFAQKPYDGVLDKSHFENKKVKINNLQYIFIADEKKMLERFTKTLKKEKVRILTGWSIDVFDNTYITNRLKHLQSDESLSPIKQVYFNKKSGTYQIAGVSVLDYIDLYKKRFMSHKLRENYKLNTIAFLELKKGKIEYDGTLKKLYLEDWNKFVEYGIVDTLLVVELEATLNFIETTIDMCSDSLIPFQRIYSTIADHEGNALKLLHSQGMVMNNINRDKIENETRKLPGGYVMAKTGIHKYCLSLDFASLYPSIIKRDNVGLENKVMFPKYNKYIEITLENGQVEKIPYDIQIKIRRENNEQIIKAEELKETDTILLD